jgi:hypothetical protein
MAFQIKITQNSAEKTSKQPSVPEKFYTEEEVELIGEKYKRQTPAVPIDIYKKSLVKEPPFTRETIVYDKHTRTWKISRDSLETR